MRENEFDRMFSDKLNGVKPAYDAQDWTAMEAMLDNKKSARPLMFWWVAALLMVTTVSAGVWYYVAQVNGNQMAIIADNGNEHTAGNDGNDRQNSNNATVLNLTENNNNDNADNSLNEANGNDNGNENITTGNGPQNGAAKVDVRSKEEIANDAGTGGQEGRSGKKSTGKKQKKSTDTNNNGNTAPSYNSGVTTNGGNANGNNKPNTAVLSTTGNPAINTSPEVNELANLHLQQLNLDEVNAAEEKIVLAELTGQDEAMKLKKGKVKFNMAVYGGLLATRTDASTWTRPGFNAGIAWEMVIKRRVGISLGMGYTQLKYGSNDVNPNYDGYQTPASYTSEITAIEIPIDIRVNMLNKGRWSLFAGAGINNMIKLSQTYEYTFAPVDTLVPNPPPTPPVTSNLGNVGGGSFADEAFSPTQGANSDSRSSGGLASSRYLPVGRVTVGVEYAVNRAFTFQAAPVFSLSVPYVGIQDKRIYSMGVDARVRYYFGR